MCKIRFLSKKTKILDIKIISQFFKKSKHFFGADLSTVTGNLEEREIDLGMFSCRNSESAQFTDEIRLIIYARNHVDKVEKMCYNNKAVARE